MFKFFKDFADTEKPTKEPTFHNVCFCAAYKWPHVESFYKCDTTSAEELCSWCMLPSIGKVVDEGIGPYEYWGQKCTHHDWHIVSDCCQADIVPNTLESFLDYKKVKK